MGKNIRLGKDAYLGKRLYFVTLCTEGRRAILRSGKRAAWLIAHLRQTARTSSFAVHAYCVMPDHVHILAEGLDPTSDLNGFVRKFKQQTAYEYRRDSAAPLWQKKYYDHILRRETAMHAVAWYIWRNPVRKQLCGRPEEYPFSGSFTLDWKQTTPPTDQWVVPWKRQDAGLKPAAT